MTCHGGYCGNDGERKNDELFHCDFMMDILKLSNLNFLIMLNF